MKSIYHFQDYKEFINHWVQSQPKEGRGAYRRFSSELGISTTMISQIFKGDKHLSLETGNELCNVLQLSDEEAEYFLLLIEFNRAGSVSLSKRLLKQIEARQTRAKKIENRIKKDIEFTPEIQAIFYSNWMYSGIRLLTAVPGYNDAQSIADRLNIPRPLALQMINFLLESNLIVQKNGKLEYGPMSTHIAQSNPQVVKHHQNWRHVGFQKMLLPDEKNLFFTSPIALSEKASEQVRAMILDFIQDMRKVASPSDSEEVRCLNIDWFSY